MQDYCPVCLELGVKMKIKLLQINLQEAVRICESDKCVWPFGYEDFIFYPRKVGKLWSCYWEECKSEPSNSKGNVPVSQGLSLSASDLISEVDILKADTNTCLDIDSVQNAFIQNTRTIKNGLRTHTSVSKFEEPGEKVLDGQSQQDTHNFLSKLQLVDTSELKSDLELLRHIIRKADMKEEGITKDTKSTESRIMGSNNYVSLVEGKSDSLTKNASIFDTQSNHGINECNIRPVPKITRVEKTNINISNVVMDNPIFHPQDVDSSSLNEHKCIRRMNKSVKKFECLDSIGNMSNNSVNTIVKPSLNVTTMEIDGLPPITLSYEVPASVTNPRPMTTKGQQNNSKTSARRNITGGKKYEKFSFNAIKKKIESENHNGSTENNSSVNKEPDVKKDDIDNNLLNSTKTEDVSCASSLLTSEGSVVTSNVSSEASSCITTNDTLNTLNVSQDTSIVNTSVNIDTVLNELWTNDYNVSEDINDDWLNSLLS